jgi:hypothetical protein
MRTSKNTVPLISLKDFGSSPFLEHGIFIEAFEDCVSVRHKRMEVHFSRFVRREIESPVEFRNRIRDKYRKFMQ